jgi:hypothetical protein
LKVGPEGGHALLMLKENKEDKRYLKTNRRKGDAYTPLTRTFEIHDLIKCIGDIITFVLKRL